MPYAYFSGRVSHEQSADKKENDYDAACRSIQQQLDMARARFAYDIGLVNSDGSPKYPGLTWGTSGWCGIRNRGEPTEDGCYVDQIVSAFKHPWAKRPAGGRLNLILQPGDTIYFAYLDRGFRDWKDMATQLVDWNKRGIRAVFIAEQLDTSCAINEMMIGILSLIAWFDSHMKSQRLLLVAERRRSMSLVVSGKLRFGWKLMRREGQKYLVPDNAVRELRLRILAMKDQQGLQFEEISDILEAEMAAAEGREPYPRVAFRDDMKRAWDKRRVARLYSDDKCGLPTRLMPPGTKDVPTKCYRGSRGKRKSGKRKPIASRLSG